MTKTKEKKMDRNTREELNALSKEVFGTSSKWKKLIEVGHSDVMERDREVMIPTKKGLEKKVFKDKKSVTKRYTLEEVRKIMAEVLEERKKVKEALANQPVADSLLDGKIHVSE